MEYRHIIWDWNGTLLDDVWLGVASVNVLLERRGQPTLTIESYRRHFDFPVRDYYERVGFDFETEPFEEAAVEFIAEYEARRAECRLHDDAEDTLRSMLAWAPRRPAQRCGAARTSGWESWSRRSSRKG